MCVSVRVSMSCCSLLLPNSVTINMKGDSIGDGVEENGGHNYLLHI